MTPEPGVWLESVLDSEEDVAGAPRYPVLTALSRPGAERLVPPLVRVEGRLEIGRIGHASPGRLVVPCPRVSREHACILAADSWFEVHDLGSSNGTYVGGSRVGKARLAQSGSILFVGSQVMILRFLSDEAIKAIEEDHHHPLMATVTRSGRTALLHRRLKTLARDGQALLIAGAPGTDPGAYAQAVHVQSQRPGRFISVKGADLRERGAEERLFGCNFGGLVAAATGGTLFIDDLRSAPLHIQDRLALMFGGESHGASPTGLSGNRMDVRLISSTEGPLAESSSEDPLCSRPLTMLARNRVRLPSLVNRKEDLGELCDTLLRDHPHWTISDRAWFSMCLYDWPGNSGELEALFDSILADHGANQLFCVSEANLPHWLRQPFLPVDARATGSQHPASDQDGQTAPLGREIERATMTRARMVEEYARRHRLSERQAQIVGAMVRGLSSKEIAGELEIDYRTVAEHLARILEKTGASDRHQLVASVVDLLIEAVNAPGASPFHRGD